MNAIFLQQMARFHQDDLARDALANRRAARLARAARRPRLAIAPRVLRTAGRLRFVVRGSAA